MSRYPVVFPFFEAFSFQMKKHLWPRRTPEAGLMGLSAITREEEFGRLDLARAGGASGVGGALEEREGQSRQYRAALRLSNMSTQLRGSRPNQERRNARERSRVHQVTPSAHPSHFSSNLKSILCHIRFVRRMLCSGIRVLLQYVLNSGEPRFRFIAYSSPESRH